MSGLATHVPGLDPTLILHTGATSLKLNVPARFLSEVQVVYNKAITQTWYVALAFACLTLFGAAVIEWKSVKGKKLTGAGAV